MKPLTHEEVAKHDIVGVDLKLLRLGRMRCDLYPGLAFHGGEPELHYLCDVCYGKNEMRRHCTRPKTLRDGLGHFVVGGLLLRDPVGFDRVEDTKARLGRAQTRVKTADLNLAANRVSAPERTDAWRYRQQELLHEKNLAVAHVRQIRDELGLLTGGAKGDPKWLLLAKAAVLLERLEEEGADLRPSGLALLEELQFHVSPANMATAQEEMCDG